MTSADESLGGRPDGTGAPGRHESVAPAPPVPPESPDQARSSAYLPVPNLDLDELLAQLIDRAQDVMSAHDRLRGLLDANTMIIGNLTLPTVLRKIAEAACRLVDARYGALGVLAEDGSTLESFVQVGVDDETAGLIGDLPAGKGLLGALIDRAEPVRLNDISAAAEAIGFPDHHPSMTTFLGVPIRVRGEVFGHLYLADAASGQFTPDDEQAVIALATTAGVAIDNARLFEQAERRQRWLQASMSITRQLLAADGEDPLALIARQTLEIADADIVTVVLPTPNRRRLMVEVAAGENAKDIVGYAYDIENTLAGQAFDTGHPVTMDDATADPSIHMHLLEVMPVGPVMALPLVGAQRTRGTLMVGRRMGRHRFDAAELDMAMTFASQASVSLELSDARSDQQRVALLEDRDRIARDLHDHVIQRLFASGLSLQGMAAGLDDGVAHRLEQAVEEIDETIRQIRTSIFELRGHIGPSTGTARNRIVTVVDEAARVLSFAPQLVFDGPVDSVVPDAMVDDIVAVAREALANVARHARASNASVRVVANDNRFTLEIIDDGVGMDGATRSSGLSNMHRRAAEYGGTLTISNAVTATQETGRGKGTHLTWTIPLT